MPKLLPRIVAVLLVPCLLGEPVHAIGFEGTSDLSSLQFSDPPFTSEALANPEAEAFRASPTSGLWREQGSTEKLAGTLTDQDRYALHARMQKIPKLLVATVYTRPWPVNMSDPEAHIVNFHGVPHTRRFDAPEPTHDGIDIETRPGAEVRAVEDGEVVWTTPPFFEEAHPDQVFVLIYSKSSRLLYFYGHLNRATVPKQIKTVADWHPFSAVAIRAGDLIGTVGHSQYTFPHLHLEARYLPNGGPDLIWGLLPLKTAEGINPLLLLQRLYGPAVHPTVVLPTDPPGHPELGNQSGEEFIERLTPPVPSGRSAVTKQLSIRPEDPGFGKDEPAVMRFLNTADYSRLKKASLSDSQSWVIDHERGLGGEYRDWPDFRRRLHGFSVNAVRNRLQKALRRTPNLIIDQGPTPTPRAGLVPDSFRRFGKKTEGYDLIEYTIMTALVAFTALIPSWHLGSIHLPFVLALTSWPGWSNYFDVSGGWALLMAAVGNYAFYLSAFTVPALTAVFLFSKPQINKPDRGSA